MATIVRATSSSGNESSSTKVTIRSEGGKYPTFGPAQVSSNTPSGQGAVSPTMNKKPLRGRHDLR